MINMDYFLFLDSMNVPVYGHIGKKKTQLKYRQRCGHNTISVTDETGNVYYLVFSINSVHYFNLDDIWKWRKTKLKIGFRDRVGLMVVDYGFKSD